MKLSFSQLSLFEECPYKWKQGYVFKKWPPKTWPLYFGSDVHVAIATAIKNAGETNHILDMQFRYLEDPEFGRHTLHTMVLSALELVNSLNLTNVHVEEHINTKLFHGYLDLFAEGEDGTYLIDWKTTSSPYTEHDIRTSDQLTAYSYLYHSVMGELPTHVCFATLDRHDGSVTLYKGSRTKDDLTYWVKKVNNVLTEISQRVDRKNPNACNGPYGLCYYYDSCWTNDQLEVIDYASVPQLKNPA